MPVMKTISGTFSVSTVKDGQDGRDGKDAHEVQPNLLLRTVFDRGIDFVKEEWTSDKWGAVSIDSQYTVEGRKTLRFTYNGSTTEIRQNVRSRVMVSTWYTLSLCYFATQSWRTFVTGTAACVDVSAGCYVDGVFQSVPADGKVEWPADMSGRRHTFTFKTLSTMPVDCIIYFRAMTDAVYLCMPKLEVGDTATAYMAHEDDLVGEQGKTGRMYYYGGKYDATSATTFLVSDAQCPFFYLQSTNNYYVYDKAPNGTYTMAQLGSPGNDNPYCTLMYNDFKYLITEAIFGSFAKFGSAIISGDWMLSTKGKVNGEYSEQYNLFDPDHPSADLGTNFIPNFAIDLKSGSLRTNNVVFPPTIMEGIQYETDSMLFKTHTKVYENPSGGSAHFCPKKNYILSGSNMCYKNVMYNSPTLGNGYVSIVLPCSYYGGYDGGDWRTPDADLADMLGCQLRITNYAANGSGVTDFNIWNVFGRRGGGLSMGLGSLTLLPFQSLLFELRYLGTTYGYQWCLLSKGDLPIFSET